MRLIYNRRKELLVAIFLLFFCAACSGPPRYAPVVEGWQKKSAAKGNNYYVVQKGDTLYSIAWAFEMDFKALALVNRLSSPYTIHRGQRLRMNLQPQEEKAYKIIVINRVLLNNEAPLKSTVLSVEAKAVPQKSQSVARNFTMNQPVTRWLWPANGKIVKGFSLQKIRGNKGIDIASSFGAPIKASAAGKVVYAGSGLRGYGNLIIIKHNDTFLSAYAHNRRLLVREGDLVETGQKIAEMGQADNGVIMLHFEIRYNGKPVDPRRFLTSS